MFNYRDFNNVQSIALKFVMLLAPAVTVTAIVFCVLSGVLSFRSMNADLQKKLDLIVRTNGGAIAEPLWNIDEEGTRSSLRTVVIHPEIVCAVVSDTIWIEVISWPLQCESAAAPDNKLTSPLNTRNQTVGRLHLFYTREPIYSQLRRDILFSALLFLLFILVSVGVAYAALKVIVKAPLDHLLASIRATELGTNKPVTHWSSNDEMGTVVTAYNRMIYQVEQHNEELIEARERAERAGASKTRFLATMSHELRTPLNAVIGITEMMRDTAMRKQENIEPYERVKRAGRHLLGLIDNILDYSKIDADRIELLMEKTATQTFVHDVKDTAAELARQNNNEFMLECGDLPAVIRVDILRLTQILINLIGNACKFTRDGTVTLAIERVDSQGEGTAIETQQGACTLSFRVTDTGIGMSQQTMDQLFADFSQVDPAVSRKYGGTGLGLVISQRLCQMMGSEIHVISCPGKGSTFRFSLEV